MACKTEVNVSLSCSKNHRGQWESNCCLADTKKPFFPAPKKIKFMLNSRRTCQSWKRVPSLPPPGALPENTNWLLDVLIHSPFRDNFLAEREGGGRFENLGISGSDETTEPLNSATTDESFSTGAGAKVSMCWFRLRASVKSIQQEYKRSNDVDVWGTGCRTHSILICSFTSFLVPCFWSHFQQETCYQTKSSCKLEWKKS